MIYLLIVFVLVFFDLITKHIAKNHLAIEEKKSAGVPNLFWWHKKNYGISYSKFSKFPKQVFWVTFCLNCLWLVVFLALLPLKGFRLLKTGFAFVLGGAAGNLIDRIRHKCVTDFIYIKGRHAPIFNAADVFILFGAVLSFLASLKIKN